MDKRVLTITANQIQLPTEVLDRVLSVSIKCKHGPHSFKSKPILKDDIGAWKNTFSLELHKRNLRVEFQIDAIRKNATESSSNETNSDHETIKYKKTIPHRYFGAKAREHLFKLHKEDGEESVETVCVKLKTEPHALFLSNVSTPRDSTDGTETDITSVSVQMEEMNVSSGLVTSQEIDEVVKENKDEAENTRKHIGWLQQDPAMRQSVDLSQKFFEILLSIRKDSKNFSLRPEAYNFAYLIVPGWMGNAFPFYMDCIITKLKKYKLPAVKAKIRTGGTVATNIPMLKQAIEALRAKTEKPILVIAHSKGSLDTMATLEEYPELKQAVFALISLQSPFGGVAVANDFIKMDKSKRNLMEGFVHKLYKVDTKSILDLTYERRQEYFAAHPLSTYNTPTFCFVSCATKGHYSVFQSTYQYLKKQYGADSDGMVIDKDAVLPGQYFAKIDGVNHGGVVWDKMVASRYKANHISLACLQTFLLQLIEDGKIAPVFEPSLGLTDVNGDLNATL
jgi:hypothetical protein